MFKGGDIHLEEIVKAYTGILYNFIRRHGYNNEEAEDILQDVFVKVWKNIDKFDENKSSFRTWIFTITKNAVYDSLRKTKNKELVFSLNEKDDNGNETEIEDIQADIFKIIERNQKKDLLLWSIDKLSREEKTILLLHFEEGLTFSEIGGVFDLSTNTIKSKYRRLLMKLKVILEELHQNIN